MLDPLVLASMPKLTYNSSVTEFIKLANLANYPTAFITEVLKTNTVHISKTKFSYQHNQSINLLPDLIKEIDALAKTKDNLSFGAPSAIDTLYHEATHAWITSALTGRIGTIQGDEYSRFRNAHLDLRQVISATITLQGGGKVTDPRRVLTEMMAEYVGHRTYAWWWALAELFSSLGLAQQIAAEEYHKESKSVRKNALVISRKSLHEVQEVESQYQKMLERVKFGYQGSGARPQRVESRIPYAIKFICDYGFLEGTVGRTLPEYPHKMVLNMIKNNLNSTITLLIR